MDAVTIPYKIAVEIKTFDGDWTAEQIDSGEAGEPTRIDVHETWYDPAQEGSKEVTDPVRIAELENSSRCE